MQVGCSQGDKKSKMQVTSQPTRCGVCTRQTPYCSGMIESSVRLFFTPRIRVQAQNPTGNEIEQSTLRAKVRNIRLTNSLVYQLLLLLKYVGLAHVLHQSGPASTGLKTTVAPAQQAT